MSQIAEQSNTKESSSYIPHWQFRSLCFFDILISIHHLILHLSSFLCPEELYNTSNTSPNTTLGKVVWRKDNDKSGQMELFQNTGMPSACFLTFWRNYPHILMQQRTDKASSCHMAYSLSPL